MSETEKFKGNVNAYLLRLERFSKNKNLASRIKFMIRDVLDMKNNKWVPRREKFTAKKIDEIRQQAETELGVQIKSKCEGINFDPLLYLVHILF